MSWHFLHDRAPGVERLGHISARGHRCHDSDAQYLFDFLTGQPNVSVCAIEHQVPLGPGVAQRVHRVHSQLDVLQRRQVEGRHENIRVSDLETLERDFREGRSRI